MVCVLFLDPIVLRLAANKAASNLHNSSLETGLMRYVGSSAIIMFSDTKLMR